MNAAPTTLRLAALTTTLFAGLLQASAAWTTIYQHNFSGLSTLSLNGVAPDFAPGAETWTLNNTTAFDSWKADGSVLAGGGSPNGRTAIQLPFTPAAGNRYQLSGTVSLSSGSGQWVGFGFSNKLNNNDGESALFAYGTINGQPWVLHSDLGGNAFQAFLGPQNQNLQFNSYSTNPTDVRMILDTTGALWKVDFYGNSPGGYFNGEEKLVASSTYTVNPTINAVGFSKGENVAGFIDNFKLEVEIIPEPGTFALALLGGLSLIAARRRAS